MASKSMGGFYRTRRRRLPRKPGNAGRKVAGSRQRGCRRGAARPGSPRPGAGRRRGPVGEEGVAVRGGRRQAGEAEADAADQGGPGRLRAEGEALRLQGGEDEAAYGRAGRPGSADAGEGTPDERPTAGE